MRLMNRAVIRCVLLVGCVAALTAAPEGELVWFKFNKAFINAHYDNGEGFGRISATTWGAAKDPHSSKCGGNDAELHVGALESGMQVPNVQSPVSAKANGMDASWGAVFELPDAKSGNGPSTLASHVGQTVGFEGFFRVWNEGHWKGAVHPSNPHHVLEVHPAWRFTFQGGSFDEPSLIRVMSGYRGYGLSKYEPVLDNVGDWLKAYQDNDFLYVQLRDSSNFFQIPVEVTQSDPIVGGTVVWLDVYSSNQYKRLVYEGLRGIVADGSDVGASLDVGDRLTLLGFFSVNLKTALDGIPPSANAPGLAHSVEDALEFFVFGKTTRTPWPKSQKCE